MAQKSKTKSKTKRCGATKRGGTTKLGGAAPHASNAGNVRKPAKRSGRPQHSLFIALVAIRVAMVFQPQNIETMCDVATAVVYAYIKYYKLNIQGKAVKRLVEKILRRKCNGDGPSSNLKTAIMHVPYEKLTESAANLEKVMGKAKEYGWEDDVERLANIVLRIFLYQHPEIKALEQAYTKLHTLRAKEGKKDVKPSEKNRLSKKAEDQRDRIDQVLLKHIEIIAIAAVQGYEISTHQPEAQATEDTSIVDESSVRTAGMQTRSRQARTSPSLDDDDVPPQVPTPGGVQDRTAAPEEDPMEVDVELPSGAADEEGDAGALGVISADHAAELDSLPCEVFEAMGDALYMAMVGEPERDYVLDQYEQCMEELEVGMDDQVAEAVAFIVFSPLDEPDPFYTNVIDSEADNDDI